jgi:flagellar biogenesis protein FliO
MDWQSWLVEAILSAEGLVLALGLIGILVLAFRRVKKRRSETFEKRDN